jgi:hypothetical protein
MHHEQRCLFVPTRRRLVLTLASGESIGLRSTRASRSSICYEEGSWPDICTTSRRRAGISPELAWRTVSLIQVLSLQRLPTLFTDPRGSMEFWEVRIQNEPAARHSGQSAFAP